MIYFNKIMILKNIYHFLVIKISYLYMILILIYFLKTIMIFLVLKVS